MRQTADPNAKRQLFGQQDGIVHFFARIPSLGANRGKIFAALFVRYLKVWSVSAAYQYFSEFFGPFLDLVANSSAQQGQISTEDKLNNKELFIDINMSDCLLLVPTDPIKGSIDEFVIKAGDIKRGFAEEPDPNINVKINVKPKSHYTYCEIILRDIQVTWRTHFLNAQKASRKRRHRNRSNKDAAFSEILIHRINDWFIAATMEAPDGKTERVTMDVTFEKAQIRLSQRILGQILRVVSSLMTRADSEISETVPGGSKRKTTFSYRSLLQELRLHPEFSSARRMSTVFGGGSMHKSRRSQTSSSGFGAEREAALLVSMMGMHIHTDAVRAHKPGRAQTMQTMLFGVLSKMVQHVVDGFISAKTAEPNPASIGAMHFLAPVMERLRTEVRCKRLVQCIILSQCLCCPWMVRFLTVICGPTSWSTESTWRSRISWRSTFTSKTARASAV